MEVKIQYKDTSVDVLINDIIMLSMNDNHWMEQASKSSLLTLHVIFIPWSSDNQLTRDNTIYLQKFTGEGQLR